MNQKYYVVSQDDAILHEGSEQECRAFLHDPSTKEIAEAKEAGMDHDQQQALFNALRYCLDTLTKADAEQVYMNF